MARFTFQLDPVLKQRRFTEQAKQLVVADLERQRMRIEESIRHRQDVLSSSKRELRTSLIGLINPNDLRSSAAASLRIMGEAQKLVLELAAIHQRLNNARAELIEATRQRRAIEILREKRFAEWMRDQNRKEDAFLDELAQARSQGRGAYAARPSINTRYHAAVPNAERLSTGDLP